MSWVARARAFAEDVVIWVPPSRVVGARDLLDGVTARVAQRLLALPAAIWHNRVTGQPITRSLIAFDH